MKLPDPISLAAEMARAALRDWGGATPEGMSRVQVADAALKIAPESDGEYPSQNANKAHYFGVSGLATEEAAAEILKAFSVAGVPRFFVYLSPSAQMVEIAGWLQSLGMKCVVEESVLARTAEHPEYSHYSIFIMFRHLALHDLYHAYRIEERLLRKEWG